MSILTLSAERHRRLCHFRRNAWTAVLLCAVLRLADTSLGLGLIEPTAATVASEANGKATVFLPAD
ncbi:hypothetical protein HGI47_19980 [Novosphingobium sp. ERN07]|uniref:hypothetical protein n=1 Tax=Novosphingobium sp. ERN07 TaxID=2726187 RepID=UPI0014570C85|nr:hypothetical protein [Novosphingobium sp. ERN07]NLR73152.1 hypothetical protein [Novosphingobium sp. ERN07]